jgi:hypothetical protein
LAIFTRKCEADLTEASYRAQAAEAEVKDIKAKCKRMQGMAQNLIDQMGEPMHRIEEAKKEYDALSARYKELEERHAELVATASSGTSAVEQDLVDMRAKVRAKTIAVESEEARLRASAFASSTAAAQPSSLETKRQDIALAEHQSSSSFFEVSAPVPPRERAPVAMNTSTKDGRESFDAWDNWATTSRVEKNKTATAPPHRRFPSEIPAVAAALGIPSDTGGGGFFDSLDDDSDPSVMTLIPSVIPSMMTLIPSLDQKLSSTLKNKANDATLNITFRTRKPSARTPSCTTHSWLETFDLDQHLGYATRTRRRCRMSRQDRARRRC